jgi:hypothetical protein
MGCVALHCQTPETPTQHSGSAILLADPTDWSNSLGSREEKFDGQSVRGLQIVGRWRVDPCSLLGHDRSDDAAY